MKVTYYPGCSLESGSKEYLSSLLEVCERLGIKANELEDWNCCGATSAHSLDGRLSIDLPARNLMLASRSGGPLLVPCAACYNRQKTAAVTLAANAAAKAEVEQRLGSAFGAEVQVQNILGFFGDKLDLIRDKIGNPLTGLRVVCYYGCLLTRPPSISGETDYEDPHAMDDILLALGATPVAWSYKTECCGASLAIARSEIVVKLIARILEAAVAAKAQAVVTACPLCQMNLDTRQREAEALMSQEYAMPIVFVSELMAAALGSDRLRAYFRRHFVDPTAVVMQPERPPVGTQ